MALEIERKFLVASDAWRQSALGPPLAIRQGYLALGGPDTPSVRVRLIGAAARLTVKGPGLLARLEFDYPIPLADAETMFATGLCAGTLIEKQRTRVAHAGLVWEVDAFAGKLVGLVLAEIELADREQAVPLPPWIGPEVTGDARYLNAALARAQTVPKTSRD